MNLMTVEEFGRRLKVGRATAYRLVATRQVETTDVAVKGRPRLRISEQALEKYVASRSERAA